MRKSCASLAALLLVFLLPACAPQPQPANPALWEVTGRDGGRAWLFGTIHSLDRPARWRTREVARALGESDVVLVEMNDLGREQATARVFAELAQGPGQPPLSQRVSPVLRGRLAELLGRNGMSDTGFSRTETWAAALSLARAGGGELNPAYGVDRGVIAAADRPIVELEGARGQLSLFDRLPEREQRDLLDAVVRDSGMPRKEDGSLAQAWLRGDMAVIEKETTRGILADPELREALFVKRNRAWSGIVDATMARGAEPFVAVGAAHMAGPDGLPAMLAARGYTVRRIQ